MTFLLDPPAIRDFAGELHVPGDPGYEERRRVVNAAVDRFPALIARCAGRAGTRRVARRRGRRRRPQWSQTVRRALAPWWGGETYPDFLARRDPSRLRAAYGPAAYERLRALRADWDPDGVLAGPNVVT